MAKKFQRNIEDFICEHCGASVIGNGYTNHCPRCLWSKHVDSYPGDRAEECGGPMEPVRAEKSRHDWTLFHKCLKCHEIRKVKINLNDNFEKLIEVAEHNQIAP